MKTNRPKNKIKLCSMFKATDRNGNIYFRGTLNDSTKLVAFIRENQDPAKPALDIFITSEFKNNELQKSP